MAPEVAAGEHTDKQRFKETVGHGSTISLSCVCMFEAFLRHQVAVGAIIACNVSSHLNSSRNSSEKAVKPDRSSHQKTGLFSNLFQRQKRN